MLFMCPVISVPCRLRAFSRGGDAIARPEKLLNEALLVKEYQEGYTSRELAERHGVSHATIIRRVSKYVDIKTRFSVVVEKTVRKS